MNGLSVIFMHYKHGGFHVNSGCDFDFAGWKRHTATMGRRSTSSTKSGKFMNPTDQASKYQHAELPPGESPKHDGGI